MRDYRTYGNMKLSRVPVTQDHIYLLHHCEMKENCTITKLRVVFNDSQESSKGNSLNDTHFPGLKLQPGNNIPTMLC